MTTIEKMAQTFKGTLRGSHVDDDGWIERGLLAVAHSDLRAALAAAHAQGGSGASYRRPSDQEPVFPVDEAYAARILEQMKEQP